MNEAVWQTRTGCIDPQFNAYRPPWRIIRHRVAAIYGHISKKLRAANNPTVYGWLVRLRLLEIVRVKIGMPNPANAA